MIRVIIGVAALIFGFSVAQDQSDSAAQGSIGNGEKNWITIEGVQRQDGTLTFSEVQIDGNGWLVIHPFEDGAPNGDKYVASAYVKNGTNSNVSIKVHKGLETGEMFTHIRIGMILIFKNIF